ncbi:MAG: Rne/Rng family ribonuclease [Frankiales bacterium]|nr:Rne/Rng family ribonuclease [Frankiales bacterium]
MPGAGHPRPAPAPPHPGRREASRADRTGDTVLDEPTSDTPTTETPAKAVRRRRATSKPAEAAPSEPAAGAPDAPAVEAESPDAAVDAPAKRVRKAPAKKAAAPRKRVAKSAAPEQLPLTEDELEAQAALLETGESVVEPAAAEQPVATESATESAAKRTRTRRPAVVTFQAPEPAAAAPSVDDADGEPDDQAPAPRRRRRAGTSGAGAPGALIPELIEPVGAAEPADRPGGADDDDDEDDDRPRRRRRGRRGRGPRLEGDDTQGESGEDAAGTSDSAGTSQPAGATESSEDDDEEGATGTRRRRRRRRSGTAGDGESAEQTPAPAREPREPRAPRNRSQGGGGTGATSADEDGVRGITGSTRMAAKRVRRQEGRDSGRKRTPILSEAEFLARREAVDRTMVVRQRGEMTQIAVLEDGVLVEHYVTKASAQAYAGNVYLGRVQNVLPSMEAAFVDIGKSRNAVLYAGEVNYNASVGGRSRSIESVLKSNQEVLVQVSKDPIGHKGARLTGQVSLPGRYLVYVPEGTMTGISRKLPEIERTRLKSILKKVVPEDAGVIIRTAAEGASEEEIAGDVRRLQAQWEVIQTKAKKGGAPILLHAEPDLVVRVVRDVFNEDFTRLVVQGDSEWDTIREYVEFVAPDLAPRLSRWEGSKDIFAEHRIDEQLAKALDRKVWLPSGGSLVIDRTEAMVVVDVNTGKYVGKGGNLEETVTRNNLEAAEEIARQLRLRDLGGIIVVDFIDMVLESNRDLVVKRLVECLGRDRTKHQVAEVTSLGLVQMTRKRVGQGLLESFSEPCEHCQGRGVLVSGEPVDDRRGSSDDDEPRRTPRPRSVKPLPADAPKPGAGVAAAVEVAEEPAAGPKRRRRGGRGSGAATVAAGDEMKELLEQPTSAQESLPVDEVLASVTRHELVGAAVDADLEIGTGLPAPEAEPAAAPKRRRRATSRPAGSPAE